MTEMFIALKGELLFIIFIPLWLIYFFVNIFRVRKKSDINKKEFIIKKVFNFILISYFLFLVGITLFPIVLPPRNDFCDIWEFVNINIFENFDLTDRYFLINFIGNVLMFAPLPILMYFNKYKKFEKLLYTIKFSFFLSLTIEMLQFIEMYFNLSKLFRAVDILDITLNVLGAIVGFYVLKLYKKLNEK